MRLDRPAQGVPRCFEGICQVLGVIAQDLQIEASSERLFQRFHAPGRVAVPILLQHQLTLAKRQEGEFVFRALVFQGETRGAAVELQAALQVAYDQFGHQGVHREHRDLHGRFRGQAARVYNSAASVSPLLFPCLRSASARFGGLSVAVAFTILSQARVHSLATPRDTFGPPSSAGFSLPG
ncbi:hypothetical protein D3C80_962380 [compost metagenome]